MFFLFSEMFETCVIRVCTVLAARLVALLTVDTAADEGEEEDAAAAEEEEVTVSTVLCFCCDVPELL